MPSRPWRSGACSPLSGSLHSPCRHLQPSHRFVQGGSGLLPLEGLCCRWQAEVMTVSAEEFLRRFLIHVLPKGLVRIRHFGLFANRRRAASLLRCRSLLGTSSSPLPAPSSQPRCPSCSEPMIILERMTCSQLHFRSTLTLPNTTQCGVDSS
jgi:hypothetical protein